MKPDVEVAIRAIMRSFNTQKFDRPKAIEELRKAMGAGAMGTALPSDEDVFTSAEDLIKGWDQNDISRAKE